MVNGDDIVEQYVLYHDEKCQRIELRDFELTSTRPWVSAQTFQSFDTCWNLRVPSLDVDLNISAVSQNQEFQTWLRMPSFYEGAVRFSGTLQGAPIKGFGAMELVKGTNMAQRSMEKILNNASSVVRHELEQCVPSSVRPKHFDHVTTVSFDSREEQVIQENIVNAFYMLNNRGGKNW